MIPLLNLGIPGSPPAAMLLGALMLHGVTPGPMITFEHPTFIMEVAAILLMIGNLVEQQFLQARNWPFGSAAALVLMAAVLAAMTYYALGPARRSAGEPSK